MKKRVAALLSAVMMVGVFSSTAFAYTGESASYMPEKESDTVTVSTETILSDDNDSTQEKESEENTQAQETEAKRIGTVTANGSRLNLRSGDGMDCSIIGQLVSGDQVEVMEAAGEWYKVKVPERTGYVHGDYLNVTEESVSSQSDVLSSENSGSSLTPDGNLTLVDDIGSASGEGQQFITLVTKAGNTFYMVIDRNDKGEENVYFLNLVDEADLLALIDEDEAAKYQPEETVESTPETVETEETGETEQPADDTKKESKENSPLPVIMLLLFVIGAAGVGGFLYIKMKSGLPYKQTENPDPDADYQDDEEALNIPEEIDDLDEDEDYDDKIEDEYTDELL